MYYIIILIVYVYHAALFKIMNLSEGQMKVARLLGITEAIANKLRDDIIPKVSFALNKSC